MRICRVLTLLATVGLLIGLAPAAHASPDAVTAIPSQEEVAICSDLFGDVYPVPSVSRSLRANGTCHSFMPTRRLEPLRPAEV